MASFKKLLAGCLTAALLITAVIGVEPCAFTDVSADAAYAQAVAWCAEEGLMRGVSTTRFDPDGTLTRAMVATVLYRAAGEPAVNGVPAFTDTAPNVWYSSAVAWANESGIVRGYGNGRFGTDDPVSVEQLEVMVGRYTGNGPEWTGDPAQAVDATRAQAAEVFYANLRKEETNTENSKVLVAYYSATGSTEAVANYIAQALEADTFALTPVDDYSSADLDWTNSSSRVNAEHEDESKRDIQLVNTTPENWADYDVVFVGYPIWWRIAAWPVNNFVKENDFTGKTVIPFCTSSSSDLGQSGELLAEMANGGDWQTGRRFSGGASQSQVTDWVKELDLSVPATEEQTGRILIAYFSMPDNVDDSTVTINGQALGNNQYFAQVIQEVTGGDVFRIEPATPYPTDHATLVDQASKEQSDDARPAIKETVADFDSYDTVFIGYPIWWSDMPQIMYTFFDQYDFSGKTIIPFNTHGGSGFAGTPAKIKTLEPGATHLDGLSISRDSIENAHDQIVEWVKGLDI